MSLLRFKPFTDILDRYIDARETWVRNGRQARGAVRDDYVSAKKALNDAINDLIK